MKKLIWMSLFFFFCSIVLSVTWGDTQLTDPLTGEKVAAKSIGSYGSYIYNWPSRYDYVFFPLTELNWICINRRNGYGAFNPHFEDLDEKEKVRVKGWLEKNYDVKNPPQTHEEHLLWLEKVYGQRKMHGSFWCRFYRLMAYFYRDDGEHPNRKRRLHYVRKAIPFLHEWFGENPQGINRIEVLYLLGEYSRRTGDLEKARRFFAEAKVTKFKDEEGKEYTGSPYFNEMIRNREKLMEK